MVNSPKLKIWRKNYKTVKLPFALVSQKTVLRKEEDFHKLMGGLKQRADM